MSFSLSVYLRFNHINKYKNIEELAWEPSFTWNLNVLYKSQPTQLRIVKLNRGVPELKFETNLSWVLLVIIGH